MVIEKETRLQSSSSSSGATAASSVIKTITAAAAAAVAAVSNTTTSTSNSSSSPSHHAFLLNQQHRRLDRNSPTSSSYRSSRSSKKQAAQDEVSAYRRSSVRIRKINYSSFGEDIDDLDDEDIDKEIDLLHGCRVSHNQQQQQHQQQLQQQHEVQQQLQHRFHPRRSPLEFQRYNDYNYPVKSSSSCSNSNNNCNSKQTSPDVMTGFPCYNSSGRNNGNIFTVIPQLHNPHSPTSPLSSPGSSLVSAAMTPEANKDNDLGSAELEIEFKKCSPTLYYSNKRMGERRATTALTHDPNQHHSNSSSRSGMDHQRSFFLTTNLTARSANSIFGPENVENPHGSARMRSCSTNYLEVPSNRPRRTGSSSDLVTYSRQQQHCSTSTTRSSLRSGRNSLTPPSQRAECMFYSDDDAETTYATGSGYDVNPRHEIRGHHTPHSRERQRIDSRDERCFHSRSVGSNMNTQSSRRGSHSNAHHHHQHHHHSANSSKYPSPSRSPFSMEGHSSLQSANWTPMSSGTFAHVSQSHTVLGIEFPRSFAQTSTDTHSRRPFVLQRSLFPNVSPTIYFGTESEDGKIVLLPKDPSKQLLVWKLSSITPTLIRETVIRSGFKLIKEKSKTRKWQGTWCKHIRSIDFQIYNLTVNKVNHFPGSFHLGRKDKLWYNLQSKAKKFGDAVFLDFHPMTYVLPQDLKALRRSWILSTGNEWKMILKPPASARGNGITVINKWSQIPKSAKVKKRRAFNKALLIVQQYISDPCLLFNGSKFDLRVYVLVTSFHPLRLFIYEEGLVRFASERYNSNQESLSDPFVHLTNYSINKINTAYRSNNDQASNQGHKWSLSTLWRYLNERSLSDVNVDHLKAKINDMVIKTVIASEDQINKLTKKYVKSRYTCYELLGFDILIDSNFKPWLLEVNISPSLRSESSLDAQVKGHLIKDMLNLVGYRMPPLSLKAACSRVRKVHESGCILYDMDCFPSVANTAAASSNASPYATTPRSPSSTAVPFFSGNNNNTLSHQLSSGTQTFMDDKFFSNKLGKEEKEKHFKYENEVSEEYYENILDNLTPDDVRILIETEDEFSRRGSFHRIFPGAGTNRYMKYFNENRYYNILLNAWTNKYEEDPAKGIEILQSLAREKYHLKNSSRETIFDRFVNKWRGVVNRKRLRKLFFKYSSSQSSEATELSDAEGPFSASTSSSTS